jgi:hypothetical protein
MQSKQSEKYITLEHNNETINMTFDTYARWLCLLEGVDFVERNMKKFGKRLKNEEIDWIKPLAFQKYITDRFESMKFELTEIDKNEDFQILNDNLCTTLPVPALT